MTGAAARPAGRDAVTTALVDAAARLIIDQGTHVSVREIAAEAGVNHGLVHAYFGTKRALLAAAFDTINQRASEELDNEGFPPADLADRRGGELARALARMQLDDPGIQFTSHPITRSWREALSTARPNLTDQRIDEMVVTAATLGLGWAVFGDQVCQALGLDADARPHFDQHIASMVAELGGLPVKTKAH